MPTYHYRCDQCDQHLEVVQSMTDAPLQECAACGGEMQKVLRPVGIVLKGSGFYRTDNRSKPTSTSSSESASKDSKSTSDASTGSANGTSTAPSSTTTGKQARAKSA